MKILKHKDVEFTLTENESEKLTELLISKNKPTHFNFRGNTLKSSMCEVRNISNETETGEKRITEYTTDELKNILGNFEKEYHEAAKGEVVRNEILGHICEGTIQHALKVKAITGLDSSKLKIKKRTFN